MDDAGFNKVIDYWIKSSDGILKQCFVSRVHESYPGLNDEKKLFLVSVTAFNINGRYDDYKMSFQKTCTLEFTSQWIDKLKENRIWIKDLIKQ